MIVVNKKTKNKINKSELKVYIPDTNWSDVIGKPTEFTPEFHTHDEYAKRYHKHTIEDIIGIESFNYSNNGNGDSNDGGSNETGHNHDYRYYTKGQVDTKFNYVEDMTKQQLKKKADIVHTHNINDLQGLEDILDNYKQINVTKQMLKEDNEGFYVVEIVHNLNSKKINVKVNNTNLKELLVDVTIINENTISILTDEKEDLIVLIQKIKIT